MPFIPDNRVCLLLVRRKAEEIEDGDGDGEGEGDGGDDDNDEGAGEEDGGGEGEVWFYLDIPLDVIDPLCLRPRKYLLYLGWCILGLNEAAVESLALGLAGEDREFHPIDNEGDLEGGGIYLLMLGDPAQGMYYSVLHERTVLIHGRHGCSRCRGHQGADGRTF